MIKKEITIPTSKKSKSLFTVAASSLTYKNMSGKKNKDADLIVRSRPSLRWVVYIKLTHSTIKYRGNASKTLFSLLTLVLDLKIFITPSIIAVIKNGVGIFIPKGNRKKATNRLFQKINKLILLLSV